MSLILKGIDLPKGYGHIHLEIYPNGDVEAEWDQDSKDYRAIQISKKHGRLIDEREVKKAQFIINDQWGSYPVISLGNLHCVPTILEAEE